MGGKQLPKLTIAKESKLKTGWTSSLVETIEIDAVEINFGDFWQFGLLAIKRMQKAEYGY